MVDRRNSDRPIRKDHWRDAMIVQTSRFGPLEVDDQRLITFEQGMLGFPQQTKFALVQTGENSGFYWLQAVDRPDLAFIVCDPRLFVTEYRAPIKAEELASIGLQSPDGAQVFVIVNKVDDMLTGNLQGPLVVNVQTRAGRQLVLSDRRYSTRHPLMRLPERDTAVTKSA
jgi:flagellar assembly factor FliW